MDKLTSLRRFYNNTYTDSEKQDAMNLFLGNYVPMPGQPAIWLLDSDYYLHSGEATGCPQGGERGAGHELPLPLMAEKGLSRHWNRQWSAGGRRGGGMKHSKVAVVQHKHLRAHLMCHANILTARW